MRTHYTKACPAIRSLIQGQFDMAAKGESTAQHAVNFCFAQGYDCILDDLPLTLTHQVESAATEQERSRIRQSDPSRYADEQAALRSWQAKRDWAANTSLEQDQKAAADKRVATEKQRADFIKRRQKEILEQRQRDIQLAALRQAETECDARFPRGAA